MLVTHNVTIDVSTPKQPNVIHVVQGDSARILRITLKNKTAIYDPEADLAKGETLNMAVTFDKSDGTRGGYERATWQASGAKAVVKETTGVYNCYLDQQCFAAPGFTHIFIRFFTSSGKTLHTFAVLCDVEKNPASNVTSEDFVDMPSNEQILQELAAISDGLDSVSEELANTVKFTAQALDDEQKAQARENINAASDAEVVKYTAQNKNDNEKRVARENIFAPSLATIAPSYVPFEIYKTGAVVRTSDSAIHTCIRDMGGKSRPQDTSYWQDVDSIGAFLSERVVRMDVMQPWLSGEAKSKARSNIGAAAKDSIAPEFDETLTYAVGDIVSRSSTFYICTTAITSPEEWTASHWTAYNTIADAILSNVVRYDAPMQLGAHDEQRREQARSNIGVRDALVFFVDDSASPFPDSGSAYVNQSDVFHNDIRPSERDLVVGLSTGRICTITSVIGGPSWRLQLAGTGLSLFHGIPAAPSEDGTYTLQATVSNGTVTYAWT